MIASLISIINLLIINTLIFFYRSNNYKILIFYHPKHILKNVSNYYIKKLLIFPNHKKIKVIILDNSKVNFFRYNFIKQYFVQYIYGVDLFLNNCVCDIFPKKCQRVYLHHDIYDSPLVNNKNEKTLFIRLKNYDHILIPSIKSKDIFNRLILNYKKEKTKLSIVGYYKLDYLKNKLTKYKKKKQYNRIIIAPTDQYAFPNMSLLPKLESIINQILSKTKINIIFRPHPSNFNNNNIQKLKKIFINQKRITFDVSKNYLKTYSNSDLMISDLSGTAYTFSFLTNRPTIFFSNYETSLKKNKYGHLNFFKDRKKIGFIVTNEKNLVKILNNKYSYHNKTNEIKRLSFKIFKSGKSKLLFNNFIYKVL